MDEDECSSNLSASVFRLAFYRRSAPVFKKRAVGERVGRRGDTAPSSSYSRSLIANPQAHKPTGLGFNSVYKRLIGRHEIEGHEVIDGEVKATGNVAHVLVPKRWRDADVTIVRTTESNE